VITLSKYLWIRCTYLPDLSSVSDFWYLWACRVFYCLLWTAWSCAFFRVMAAVRKMKNILLTWWQDASRLIQTHEEDRCPSSQHLTDTPANPHTLMHRLRKANNISRQHFVRSAGCLCVRVESPFCLTSNFDFRQYQYQFYKRTFILFVLFFEAS